MAKYSEWSDPRTGRVHRIVTIVDADDVSEELLTAAEEIESGWFSDGAHIDWEDFFERLEKWTLDEHDGREIDLGPDSDTPAMRRIKKHIRDLRRLG